MKKSGIRILQNKGTSAPADENVSAIASISTALYPETRNLLDEENWSMRHLFADSESSESDRKSKLHHSNYRNKCNTYYLNILFEKKNISKRREKSRRKTTLFQQGTFMYNKSSSPELISSNLKQFERITRHLHIFSSKIRFQIEGGFDTDSHLSSGKLAAPSSASFTMMSSIEESGREELGGEESGVEESAMAIPRGVEAADENS
nr:hypothetical protein Iba_chr09cCG7600 [Ipomoea batatas]